MDTSIAYTKLSRRIKALLYDGLALAGGLFITIFLVTALKLQPPLIESVLIIFIVISIEPFFISITGSSIGHHIVGLRVRRSKTDKRLNIFFSYLRFMTKLPLGIISFFLVLTTRKHQAFHDLVSSSIVVHKISENMPSYEILTERIDDTEKFVYPSKTRRAIIIFIYFILCMVAFGLLSLVLLSNTCLDGVTCTNLDTIYGLGLEILFWISFFTIVSFGWKAELYGCKRKVIEW